MTASSHPASKVFLVRHKSGTWREELNRFFTNCDDYFVYCILQKLVCPSYRSCLEGRDGIKVQNLGWKKPEKTMSREFKGFKWEVRKPLWVIRWKPQWETDTFWSLKHPVQPSWLDPSPIRVDTERDLVLTQRMQLLGYLKPVIWGPISHIQTLFLIPSPILLQCLPLLAFFFASVFWALQMTLCHSHLGVSLPSLA